MKLYSENDNYKLYQGSMLDMLEVIEPNSIDSIVTDPPYELNFMGKGWDNSGIAFQSDTWKKCYEVLKPGGYLLAFGGSRTFHRIACAIEDAGFEIRDTICYMYGSGFPKSQNIGKQLEKRLEDEKTKQKTEHDLLVMWERNIQKTKSNEETNEMVLQSQLQEQGLQKSSKTTSNVWREKPSMEGWNNIQKTERELQWCQICEMSKRVFINGEERWVCDGTQNCNGKVLRQMFDKNGSCPSYRPQPEQQFNRELNAIQEQWGTQACREVIENWKKIGTALKPSFEPIIVARKPFKGSLVDNVIEYGVGGINIDECRVETNDEVKMNIRNTASCSDGWNRPWMEDKEKDKLRQEIAIEKANNLGRFPANTILTYDETDFDEVCGGFPDTNPSKQIIGGANRKSYIQKEIINPSGWKEVNRIRKTEGYNDNGGSASRYFYCAKASKKDRDEGCIELEDGLLRRMRPDKDDNNPTGLNKEGRFAPVVRKNTHPTVKPTELMQYLVRLVSPNGATILDPFNGSGSTGKAVMYENKERNKGYKYIGIELTEEYLPIAKARIEYACNLIEEEKTNDKQLSMFDLESEVN